MTNNNFLLVVWPGISIGCFLAGMVGRYALSRRKVKKQWEEMSHWRKALSGNWLLQLSMGLLVVGHLAALLLPQVLVRWDANPARLYVLEGCALVVGLASTFSTVVLIWRHLHATAESILSEVFDTVFLGLLFVGLVSGIGIAVTYRWGSSWVAITLTPYLDSVLRGRPVIDYIFEMPPLIRLHVFCAFSALAVVPLTRLSFVLLYAMDAGIGFIHQVSLRPVTILGDYAEVFLRNISSRLWPEED
jgi:nitrate reductase gamma subunit